MKEHIKLRICEILNKQGCLKSIVGFVPGEDSKPTVVAIVMEFESSENRGESYDVVILDSAGQMQQLITGFFNQMSAIEKVREFHENIQFEEFCTIHSC